MMRRFTFAVAALFGLVASMPVATAEAGLLAGLRAARAANLDAQMQGPASAESLPAPTMVTATYAQASGCAPAPCCPAPTIIYRHWGPKLCCGCCQPPVETVLTVNDPCTCCPVNIPVCVPACCQGQPTVSNRSGLLGCCITEFEWCCGFRVTVKYKRCGDIVVVTHGR